MSSSELDDVQYNISTPGSFAFAERPEGSVSTKSRKQSTYSVQKEHLNIVMMVDFRLKLQPDFTLMYSVAEWRSSVFQIEDSYVQAKKIL